MDTAYFSVKEPEMKRICSAALSGLVAIFLTASASSAAVRAVARWDVVPDQLMNTTFKAGVVAFHMSGIKVEFRVNDKLVATVRNPTLNDRTGVWEFWFPLDPAEYPDGAVTVNARAIPLEPDPVVYDLPPLNLYANSKGSLTVKDVKWVDAAGGSDSNTGSQASPYQTIAKAVRNTAVGGTINLQAGSYSCDALGGGSNRPYWTTIQAAPGVGRDAVEVGHGRPNTQRLRWKDLTFYLDDASKSYRVILVGEGGSHSVWLENDKFWNKQGRWAAQCHILGNGYRAYVIGGLTTQMTGGPGSFLLRGHTMQTLCADGYTNCAMAINCTITGIDPGETGIHPDLYQSYATADKMVSDVILYNCRGYQGVCMGYLVEQLENSAFVNVLFEKAPTVMSTEFSGRVRNVLVMHNDHIGWDFLWRNHNEEKHEFPLECQDVQIANSIFSGMKPMGQANLSGVAIDSNHFIDPIKAMGTHQTTGNPFFQDAAHRDYHLPATSPAYGSGRCLQCVPADIDGVPYGDKRNRGCYAGETPAKTEKNTP